MEFSGQYLTYEEYQALGGTLERTPFNLLEYEARKQIDARTRNRLHEVVSIPQEVKMCENTLINTILSYTTKETDIDKNKSSEKVGSYSVTFISPKEIQELIKSKQNEIDDIILDYLTWVVVNGEHIIFLGDK